MFSRMYDWVICWVLPFLLHILQPIKPWKLVLLFVILNLVLVVFCFDFFWLFVIFDVWLSYLSLCFIFCNLSTHENWFSKHQLVFVGYYLLFDTCNLLFVICYLLFAFFSRMYDWVIWVPAIPASYSPTYQPMKIGFQCTNWYLLDIICYLLFV